MKKKAVISASIALAALLCVPTFAFAFGGNGLQASGQTKEKSAVVAVEEAVKAPTAETLAEVAAAEVAAAEAAAVEAEAAAAVEPAQDVYYEEPTPAYGYHYGYIDNDGNGICDNYENGSCDGYGYGCGYGNGYCDGTGYGNGYGGGYCGGMGYGAANGGGYGGGHHGGGHHGGRW